MLYKSKKGEVEPIDIWKNIIFVGIIISENS